MIEGSQPEEIRRNVLRAAERVLDKAGYEGLTHAAVAAEAGVPEEAVASRYADADELLIATAKETDFESNERTRARITNLATSAEKMLVMIEAWTLEADWTIWIELWSRALRSPRVAAARQELDDEFRRVIADVVAEGQARGEFIAGDVDRLAVTIATTIDSFALLTTLQDSTVSPNFMLEECSVAIGALLGVKLRPGLFTQERQGSDA